MKKAFALVLTIAIALTLLPTAVLAAGEWYKEISGLETSSKYIGTEKLKYTTVYRYSLGTSFRVEKSIATPYGSAGRFVIYAYDEDTGSFQNRSYQEITYYVGSYDATPVFTPEKANTMYHLTLMDDMDAPLHDWYVKVVDGNTSATRDVVDGFDIENGVLTAYTGPGGDVVIPDTVTAIGPNAFNGNRTITSVTIPSSVKTVQGFDGCLNLTSVRMSEGVTTIGDNAFRRCSKLTGLTIPNSVTKIGSRALSECTSLNSIRIPSGVTKLEEGLFLGSSALTSVSLPDTITEFEHNVFNSCASLTNVAIPASVQEMANGEFYGCTSLKSIAIPDGITSIGFNFFFGCTALKSITIPASVTSIGVDGGALRNCNALTDVYYGGTREQWEAIRIGSDSKSVLDAATIHYSDKAGAVTTTVPNNTPNADNDKYKASDWAKETINATIDLGIYDPEAPDWWSRKDLTENCRREDFCLYVGKLFEALGKKDLIDGAVNWTDWPFIKGDMEDYEVDNPALRRINALYHLGIVNGTSTTNFSPHDSLTREQAATILIRAADVLGIETPNSDIPFTDSISSWAVNGVRRAYGAKLMNGYSATEFGAKDAYTCEQALITVYRLYNAATGGK